MNDKLKPMLYRIGFDFYMEIDLHMLMTTINQLYWRLFH